MQHSAPISSSRELFNFVRKFKSRRFPPDVFWEVFRICESSEIPKDVLFTLKTAWKDRSHLFKKSFPPHIYSNINNFFISIPEYDETILNMIIKGKNVLFLLGAGASAPSNIPTVDKLLPDLWKRAGKIGRNDLDNLSKWCTDRKIYNIEDLLTAAYVANFASQNASLVSLLKYFLFPGEHNETIGSGSDLGKTHDIITRADISSIYLIQDTLQTLFGLLASTMITANPNKAHKAIVSLAKIHHDMTIITTNYDGCMDEALLKNKMKLCSTISPGDIKDESTVRLIKIHGSINWAYCESCHIVKEHDLLEMKKFYEKDRFSYPVIGVCANCGGLRRPLLVPPLSFKFLQFPTLIDIWNSARCKIEDADIMVVVGYSFSEADTYITKIISRSMSINEKQKMIVVNTDVKLAQKLREKYVARIDEFDGSRILSITESADKALPKIVNKWILNYNKKHEEKQRKAKTNTKSKKRVKK